MTFILAWLAKAGIGSILRGVCSFVFDTRLGQYLGIGAVVAGLFFGWLTSHDSKVRAKQITQINENVKTITKKAIVARRKVKEDGAFERLQRTSCVDCKR